ncbi:MAG: putative acetyltransferase [Arcticibacterium sp.]|jgi:putative acetyltransferase
MNIRKAESNEIKRVRELFEAYAKELDVDLCFQNFAGEMDSLPGVYSEPEGCILVLENDKAKLLGAVALKKLENGICEMKRLYLEPSVRKSGFGKKMANAIMDEAKHKGYKTMKLDTLQRLETAVGIYKKMGFVSTKPYNYNPENTVLYFEKAL